MSKKTFCDVTQSDIEKLLFPLGFERIEIQIGTTIVQELVYAKRVHQGNLQLSLRVFTGINRDGHSRACGEDAMRVQLAMRDDEGKIFRLADERRVNRIQTWRDNLKKRLDHWADELMPKETCSCGSPMIVREGKRGKFLGCVRYPNCRKTKNIKE